MSKQPNFRVELKAPQKARVEIYDEIGPSWAGMIDARSVSEALNAAGDVKDIDVHINSPGGSAFDGIAIFNILKKHPANVHVHVDGVAASAASLIAMAGDTIEMPKNALLMIHDPFTFAAGGEDDLLKAAEMLSVVKQSAVETYATKTKAPREQIAQWMKDETWFNGDSAVEAGLADKTGAEVKLATVPLPSEPRTQYRRAPSELMALCALSISSERKDSDMANDAKTADQLAQEQAALKAEQEKAAQLKADQEKAVKDAADAERKRAADITAACNKAQRPDLAAKFIEEGKSLGDVGLALVDALCAKNPPSDDGQGGPDLSKDEDAAYKAEYAKDKATYVRSGIDEAGYVAMRRIDDGKQPLVSQIA